MAKKRLGNDTETALDGVIYNPGCTRCSKLCAHATNVCIPGDGPDGAEIMILGEAPGKYEDQETLPFVGAAGQYLREELLVPAGLSDDDVYMTNAVRCRPPKNRTPTARELQQCRSYLEAEIHEVKPRVIVAMGNPPLATLLGFIYKPTIDSDGNVTKEGKVSGISRWRGRSVWSREFGCWVMPTFHPSYAMRLEQGEGSVFVKSQIISDLAQAPALVGRSPKYTDPKSIHVTDPREASAMLKSMMRAGTFAYDIETGGAGRACDKRIIGCSFSCSVDEGYYIEWDLIESNAEVRRLYREAVAGKYRKIMHSGDYEIRIHRANNIPINDVYVDTIIAAHMVDENFGKSLKDLTWVYTGFGGYDTPLEKYKAEHRVKEDYSKIPVDILAPYGGLDAVATYIIWKHLRPVMVEEGYAPLYDKIIMPVRKVMSEAEHHGLRVNVAYAERLNELCTSSLTALEQRVYELVGHEFNINSSQQLSKVLFDDLGYRALKRTKTGWSVDAETIEYVAGQGCEVAGVLTDRNFLKTMISNHISQALQYHWPEDHRVHTAYHMDRAVTGRTSCSGPGIHNVPRDRLIRTMYVASPGHLLIEADLKSAELAYLAAESREQAFIQAFENGLDLHRETAKVIFGVEEPTAEQRAFAKSTNFALVYGMTAFGLSKRLKISLDEAEDFIDNYFARFPRIARYMERQRANALENQYVASLFRRRRRLPQAGSDVFADVERALRQAQNSPIQSGAADYTYLGLVRLGRGLKREGMRAKIVHTVHDCALVDTPVPELERVKSIIHEAFETAIKIIPVQMKVEIESGRAWGEHTEESRVLNILTSVCNKREIDSLLKLAV